MPKDYQKTIRTAWKRLMSWPCHHHHQLKLNLQRRRHRTALSARLEIEENISQPIVMTLEPQIDLTMKNIEFELDSVAINQPDLLLKLLLILRFH